MKEALTKIRITNVEQGHKAYWAENECFKVPDTILFLFRDHYDSKKRTLFVTSDICIDYSDVEALRHRVAMTDNKPLSSKLPISYQIVSPTYRSIIASFIGKIKRKNVSKWADFPMWPIDLSVDFLADLAGLNNYCLIQKKTPVILSHDIDSHEGLNNLVGMFLDIEEKVGAISSNYIVPCAWKLDENLLKEVQDRGHEIGVHGYDHSNKTPFLEKELVEKRVQEGFYKLSKYNVLGYRSPSLLRTQILMNTLKKYYSYDSSIPTTGGLFPVPNNGCASARLFKYNGIIELPLTMPRDGSLLFLGYEPNEIFKVWVKCAKKIAASKGIVVLLTHCEERFSGNKEMLTVYTDFLEFISNSPEFIWSNPSEVIKRSEFSQKNKAQKLNSI